MNTGDEVGTSTAAIALEALSQRLAQKGLEGVPLKGALAAETSEKIKNEWIRSGMLISGAALSAAWDGWPRQALDRARKRHELVSLKISGKHYYPGAFLTVSAKSAAVICKLLQDVDPVAQMIFWARPHGAIGGKTLEEALSAGASVESVSFLAITSAEEHTGRSAT